MVNALRKSSFVCLFLFITLLFPCIASADNAVRGDRVYTTNGNFNKGDYLLSAAGKYIAIWQGDGNFVVYRKADMKALWATNTNNQNATTCCFQGDGNFVIYANQERIDTVAQQQYQCIYQFNTLTNQWEWKWQWVTVYVQVHTGTFESKAIWSSKTAGNPGAFLTMQDDSNLVIYTSSGKAIWACGIKDNNTPVLKFDFNAEYYLNKYPDIVKAFGYNFNAAYNHWLTYGIKEGRQGASWFDPVYYLNKYPDLVKAFGSANYAAARNHWLTYGIKEGRQGSPDFSIVSYVNKYPDLKQAFGNNYVAAFNHWLTYGIKEGRNGTP